MKKTLLKIARKVLRKGEQVRLLFCRNPIPRDPTVLMERARQQTGFSDFGLDVFVEGYRKLHYSLRHEAQLHPRAREETARCLLLLLCNRLIIEASKTRCPDVANEKILRPVFIVGLPRTGSTFLQRLIAADPAWHHLVFEEAIAPAPPPALSPELTDHRREVAEKYCRYMDKVAPQIQQMHLMKPDSPEECYFLMRNNFMSQSFRWFGSIPTYMEWLQKQDMKQCCQAYHYQLKLLQHGRVAKRWILKTPSHWTYLPTLLDTFPDASLVITYREPKDIISSWVQLSEVIFSLYSPPLFTHEAQIPTILGSFRNHVDFLQEVLEQHSDIPVLNVPFKNFTNNPLGTVKVVYEAMRQPFSKDSEDALMKFLERDSEERQSHPKQDSNRVELDTEEIATVFATYLDRLKEIEENFPIGY